MIVGDAPVDLGPLDIAPVEMMFCQYLPVRMPGSDFRFPANVMPFRKLLPFIAWSEESYVYLTVKNLFVNTHSAGRPGWHLDGFGTDDRNYIWYDGMPTEFCIQSFSVSTDHEFSIKEMTRQAEKKNIRTYPDKHLLALSPRVVHRVSTWPDEGYRCFAKISVSRHRYNLIGNARNYLFDYDWPLSPRGPVRNHPTVVE